MPDNERPAGVDLEERLTTMFQNQAESVPDRTLPHLETNKPPSARTALLAVPVVLAVLSPVAVWRTQFGAQDPDALGAPGAPPIIVRTEPADEFMPGAQVSGELALEDGCLLVGGDAAVWPTDTKWLDVRQAVETPSSTFEVGQSVNASGAKFGPDMDLAAVVGEAPAKAAIECNARVGGTQVVVIN